MELQNLTKAELIAIIRNLEKNNLCKRHVVAALNDVQRKSEYAAIEESEKAKREYLAILGEYYELMRPYNGGKITDIPTEKISEMSDCFKRLHEAEKNMHDADARYNKLAGERMNDCESCIHYPPSSMDGKPCSSCDTNDVYLNCYQPRDEL